MFVILLGGPIGIEDPGSRILDSNRMKDEGIKDEGSS
jgi:hypothetical protein